MTLPLPLPVLVVALLAVAALLYIWRKRKQRRRNRGTNGASYVLTAAMPDGMAVVDDFISEDEAAELLAFLDSDDGKLWDSGDVK